MDGAGASLTPALAAAGIAGFEATLTGLTGSALSLIDRCPTGAIVSRPVSFEVVVQPVTRNNNPNADENIRLVAEAERLVLRFMAAAAVEKFCRPPVSLWGFG